MPSSALLIADLPRARGCSQLVQRQGGLGCWGRADIQPHVPENRGQQREQAVLAKGLLANASTQRGSQAKL